jgi:hypothetical protein
VEAVEIGAEDGYELKQNSKIKRLKSTSDDDMRVIIKPKPLFVCC